MSDTGQDAASATKNASYFDANSRYTEHIGSLDTYKNIRDAIDREIDGAELLLDVGNGGVFDYDTTLVQSIVGVDLFLDGTPDSMDENIVLRRGDALALEEPAETYDRVLEISVFHHLIGADVDSTLQNVRRAIEEAHRVLRPGGRFVVMESCVSKHAFSVERRLFSALRLLARTPMMSHPATLQFPASTIAEAIGEGFGEVTVAPIPAGRWILQFGLRWPTVLTPARPYLFIATRPR
jgi:SAM-dependent methyltransferase